MHELNSFDRYKEGKRLSDKYTKLMSQFMILMVITGIGGMVALELNGICGLWSIAIMLIPSWFSFRFSLLATKGNMMMKSAEITFGDDEEEYL